MAETINGLYKNEVIHRRGPWKGLDDVEYATLEWVDWFNHHRILEPIGDVPPAEYEANYYRQNSPAGDAGLKQNSLRQTRTGSFHLMYLPSFCTFRMTDIWRSFVAQRIAWANGWSLVFHSPNVWQDRNEHDLLVDFRDEVPGYLHNAEIALAPSAVDVPSGIEHIGDAMRACYQTLIDTGLIGDDELKLLDLWLAESATYLR